MKRGYFVYCGRSDDMLKVGGIWCSPVEIENRLVEHPKVLEAASSAAPTTKDSSSRKPTSCWHEPADAGEALAVEL